MLKLTERLQQIADFLPEGQSFVDIGTDHGYLPIYMAERGKSPYIILADINEGPMEIARAHVNQYLPEFKPNGDVYKNNKGGTIKLVKGNGLEPIVVEPVENCVIAGMGGLLIASIIEAELEKAIHFSSLILQPRNAQDKLRRFLYEQEFVVLEEALVRENQFIWEIVKVCHKTHLKRPNVVMKNDREQIEALNTSLGCETEFQKDFLKHHIGYALIINKDPLLGLWLTKKIQVNQKIIKGLTYGENPLDSDLNQRKITQLHLENQIMSTIIAKTGIDI